MIGGDDMSEVRLVIRDAQRQIHANRHGSFADSVIAALSAEPETIEQLEVALERFIAPGEWSYLRGFLAGAADEPCDAGLVVVDLAARLVVCDSTYCLAAPESYVPYHDGKSATDVGVRYHLSDDWRLMQDATNWRAAADERRRQRLAHPPLDARAVMYREPLLKFIARECFESFHDRAVVAEPDRADPIYQQERDLVRQVHVRWLITPRDDLRGRTPRQVMMARRDFVGWSIQDREEQWSQMGRCPRGLDFESAAYLFAGFGTHEMVVYYDMVRYLLWCCRQAVGERVQGTSAADVTVADFAADAIVRLAELREQWLDAPEPEFDGRTPRSIIHNERARIPEGMTGQEAMIDRDCPLCQMQAEMPGPAFWGLDGCEMDEDFAFSMWHDTYEQWEQEQREDEESAKRWRAKEAERRRLGVAYPSGGHADPDSVWKTSFSAPESPGEPTIMRLFAIGSHLSELIVDLKEPSEAPGPSEPRGLIDRLSRVFGNLREVAQSADPATADALIQPVLASFCDTLDAVGDARPDLTPKCSNLQHRLRRLLEPPDETDDAADVFDDDDLPY